MARFKDHERFVDEQLEKAVAMLEEDVCCYCGQPCAPDQVFCSMCQLQMLAGKVSFNPLTC